MEMHSFKFFIERETGLRFHEDNNRLLVKIKENELLIELLDNRIIIKNSIENLEPEVKNLFFSDNTTFAEAYTKTIEYLEFLLSKKIH